ncbi:uncharacterized protein LOC132400802 [Hypanus sabinus]|uniref:uncharacterized protein LOC132400802 n=1 Tax=Hypanus sabinus TaxID=79690 RepID=UPI0028C3FA62|nr:uncharacterized protein LOC132400802 [Hypanus sabinus]
MKSTFARHGIPDIVVGDNGPQYASGERPNGAAVLEERLGLFPQQLSHMKVVRMEPSESPASRDRDLSWSWLWVVLILGIIFLIILCLWCWCKNRVRSILSGRFNRSYRTLPCQVECYGQGQIHTDIVKKLNITEEPGAPLVLFVYKATRETEDLRNALQWIEGNRKRSRDEICAVILLEKSLDKQKKPVEVAHQGMFDANTVVVRILWQQRRNSPDNILDGPSNKAAMEKVKQSIRCKSEERFQSNTYSIY